ncbi:hypothetical protein AQJ11_44455 [Streptomyces corchorusii]|uniref:Uncharacterized protein n=2 Tax=Streptomyces TaxID=1883 RepID=A0A117Q8K9_STRCK|nr:hypothetical protein [Streptomyces corchorusii]KUN14576.1 hypothetical protein AQJ11_44455 [Streptomyces corchorusii]
MSDTDRLYALSSTYTHPGLSDVDGPGLLINDAIVAMRWYLNHEREENLAVAEVSEDGGVTWRAITPASCTRTPDALLPSGRRRRGRSGAALLREALAAEAAEWLDHRIRYVQPDDPVQHRPRTPGLASWRRGGQIWALALDTVPDEQVLTHLAGHYADSQPEGPERARTGALDTLNALVLADDPADADIPELLRTLRHVNRLTFGFEIGQLKARAEQAQHKILNQLISRHPQTAAVARAHPDPQHPAQRAARTYLHRLSLIGADGEERLLADAARDFTEALEALQAAEAARPPATAAPDADTPGPEPIPGYPRQMDGDLQAQPITSGPSRQPDSPTSHRAVRWRDSSHR